MSYKVHRFEIDMETDSAKLEVFLNGLDGEIVSIIPNVRKTTLAQIYALAGAGADIVRVTCNTIEAAQGLAEMMPRSPVPIVADIHYQYKLALAAIEAGVSALRLNPGNIRKFDDQVGAIAKAAKDRGTSIRIGVNAGSLDKRIMEKYGKDATVNVQTGEITRNSEEKEDV